MTGYILDENLPRRLTVTPSLLVLHATDIAVSPTDTLLWEHARVHRMAINAPNRTDGPVRNGARSAGT